MTSQLTRTNSSFHGVPKIKLSSSKNSLVRDSPAASSLKQTLENTQIPQNNTPCSVRPGSKSQSGLFLTPKEGRQLSSTPQGQQKTGTTEGNKYSAFTDYYNQHVLLPTKLPLINKSNTNKHSTKQSLDESGNSSSKMAKSKIMTFSSEVSNFDLNSNASTQDNIERAKGKSSFFRTKPQRLSCTPSQHESQQLNSNFDSNYENMTSVEGNNQKQVYQNNMSPISNDQTGLLSKQSEQQLSIKTLYEEQKRQLQRVEDITSPFPPKSQRNKPTGRMSLNVQSTSNINFKTLQQTILSEKIGGQQILKSFAQELLFAMKKVEFFDIFLEEYHTCLDTVQEYIRSFILNVLSNNELAIQNSITSFLRLFCPLNDSNIFEIKSFMFEFLTAKQGCNNTFLDKSIAFKIVEFMEVYRSFLTSNEEGMNLYEVSQIYLRDDVIENCVTTEFFKKFDLEKINNFSKTLIDFLFNKITTTDFNASFYTSFNTNLTLVHINILKDVLKKSLSDLREYNSVFRKNISYQLKKVQWLLPASSSSPNYIDIVGSCPDLYSLMSKIAPQIMEPPHADFKSFAKFIKLFYSKYNVFNMTDIFQIFDIKRTEPSKQKVILLSSLLRQALLASKISPEITKKIETFTLSIFD